MDIGTYWENANKVKATLERAGFKRVRCYRVLDDGGLEECYKHHDFHTTIDIFYFRRDNDVMFCNSFIPLKDMSMPWNLHRNMPFKVKRIEVPDCGYEEGSFKGCKIYVPREIHKYLTRHYGESYMVPNPNYDSKKDSSNITYYSYEEKPGAGFLTEGY